MNANSLQPLVMVPCGSRKTQLPQAPAGQLYIGSYHLACRRAAAVLTTPDRILILSAMHGLLPLDRVIAPYELRMGDPDPSRLMCCAGWPRSCTWSTSRWLAPRSIIASAVLPASLPMKRERTS